MTLVRRSLLVAALAAPPWLASAAAVDLPGPAFPDYRAPAQLTAACGAGLKVAAAAVKKLEATAASRWIAAYDEMNAQFEDAAGPVFLLSNVHPDKAVRDAAEACELKWQELLSSLGQNAKLYQRAKQVKPRDAVEREFLRTTLDQFEDAGVSLPGAKRQRAKAIIDRIGELAQQFDRRIRDDATLVPFTEDELKGVPPEVWKDAKRDPENRILLGISYPVYIAVLQGAENGGARERMWRAKQNEGGEANLGTLDEIAGLRKELAGLFGFDSYDDYVLRRRMVGSTPNALAFLAEVKAAVAAREVKDIETLTAAKARHLGTAAPATRLERWDVAFYTEREVRDRYTIDQESFRKYFPPQESLQFTLRVIEKMMGVKYTRVEGVKLWHPEVQAYQVSDVASGKPIATLYVDLYPREGKYNHAAVWSYRNASTRLNRAPQAALVVNFDRRGLTLDELETLLHELGHAVHADLSATRFSSQGGTNTVHDFSEAPSQMLEDWVYDKSVLKVFAEVCPTCTPVPDDLVDKAKAVKEFDKGIAFARQHLYASFDLALHGPDAPKSMPLWEKMEGATPLGYVPGTRFPAGFGHVASGYAAGYYGYLWSLVVAMDLRTAFEGKKLDPAVGMRYRQTVLAHGGERPARELVAEFLGRETNSKAFFDYLKR